MSANLSWLRNKVKELRATKPGDDYVVRFPFTLAFQLSDIADELERLQLLKEGRE